MLIIIARKLPIPENPYLLHSCFFCIGEKFFSNYSNVEEAVSYGITDSFLFVISSRTIACQNPYNADFLLLPVCLSNHICQTSETPQRQPVIHYDSNPSLTLSVRALWTGFGNILLKEGLLSDDIISIKYMKVEIKGILINNFIFYHYKE